MQICSGYTPAAIASQKSHSLPAQENNLMFARITVSEPVKQGEGLSLYISYKINTETDWPCFNQREFSVIRRYNDFLWLHQHLCQDFPGLVIPPLPEKQNIGACMCIDYLHD
jgi:sorting nexin-1/2